MEISYQLLDKSKRKTPPSSVTSFGSIRTDHVFLADYADGLWQNARIAPYAPMPLYPGAMCLHYGQTIFEGAKAFRHADGELYLFRGDMNAKRLNHSAAVTMMPAFPEDLFMDGLMRLLDVDRAWCPKEPESSMYIRPFMFATEDHLGVRPSKKYTFCIMLSPSGPYYSGGFNHAVTLLITKKYHRAVSGGTGTAKTGGNYVASLVPAEYAYKHNASQVLYLDAANERLEEVGSMNHYHVMKDGTFIIPEFNDSILRSITSVSVLELAAQGIIKARQEVIHLDTFLNAIKSGDIIEAGGFGTAAVISPVNKYLMEDGSEITVGDGSIGKHSRALYELYTDIQNGRKPAPKGWLRQVPHVAK